LSFCLHFLWMPMVIFLVQLHHFKLSHKGLAHKLFLHVLSNVTWGFVLFLQLEFYIGCFSYSTSKCPLVCHPSNHWSSIGLYKGLPNGTLDVAGTMKNYDTYFKELTCKIGIHDNCSCLCVEVCQVQHGLEGTIISCSATSNVLKGLNQLWTSIIYPKEPLFKWNLRKCLMEECDECDVESLPLCPKEYESTMTIS
jgi:hypothetical protein